MKKVLLVLAIALVAVVGVSAQVTDSAVLNLQGTIGPFVDISVWSAGVTLALESPVSTLTPVSVGSATITSNTGYEVDVASANSFAFVNGLLTVPYAVHWNAGAAVSTAGTLETGAGGVSGATRSIAVSYAAAPGTHAEGTYTDSLTFTISSN